MSLLPFPGLRGERAEAEAPVSVTTFRRFLQSLRQGFGKRNETVRVCTIILNGAEIRMECEPGAPMHSPTPSSLLILRWWTSSKAVEEAVLGTYDRTSVATTHGAAGT